MIGFDERDADLASRAGRALCRVLLPVLGAYALFGLAQACTGCHPRTPAEAEAAYTAEQTACVVDGHTKGLPLSAVRECREASDRKWGVPPRDGGR